jgi:hypothetical protein
MFGVPGRRRPQTRAFLGLAIYAVFLVTAPFEHHDLLCHLKTPTHCTACTSSVVGSGPNLPVVAGAFDLPDAGGTQTPDVVATGFLLAVHSTGRSPPATV